MAHKVGKVVIEFEPLVKVTCFAMGCKYNLNRLLACNLKHLDIGSGNRCVHFEPRDEPPQEFGFEEE